VTADPWWWQVIGPHGDVLASGRQWTRLLAPAQAIAEERIAAWAWPLLCEGRAGELVGVTCRVWRQGERRSARASADRWARRAGAEQVSKAA
jgi:hypothetical protein